MRAFAAVLVVGVFAVNSLAADQATIAAAVKKGGEFLRGRYVGGVTVDPSAEHGLGGVALSGLAMLEAGIKPDDKVMAAVADTVRTQSLAQSGTYHIALCIIFLDRYGEKRDVPLVQTLGVRLYAGMNAAGGWTYKCWEDTAKGEAILKALQTNELSNKPAEKPADKKDDFVNPPKGKIGTLHAYPAKLMADVQAVLRQSGRSGVSGHGPAGDDNSNTQFGIVGLWVAARNGVPAADAFAALEARYVRSQNRDGGWGYASGGGTSTVAMTCAGLLGLAVGRTSREVRLEADKKPVPKDLPPDDPFFTPKKENGEKADPVGGDKPKGNPVASDKAVEAGLGVLAGFVAAQARGGNGLNNFVGLGNSLYTLWSLERVCVAYNLETLGGADWYGIGADYLLKLQTVDGAFNDSSYGADVNTSFAILFLCKSNFTKELGVKSKAKDPGKGELRGGGGPGNAPLYAPAPKEGGKSAAPPPDAERPGSGGFALPKVTEPTEAGEAEKVSETLQKATDDTFAAELAKARDGKGGKWTRGIVLAIGKLDGDKRYQAREALAERLTRMTARTLREMLRDPETELRRAACLACGMKEDKGFAPDLIGRLTDPSEYVVRAARASLKSLTDGNDFGPTNAADDEAKFKAVALWTAYFNQK